MGSEGDMTEWQKFAGYVASKVFCHFHIRNPEDMDDIYQICLSSCWEQWAKTDGKWSSDLVFKLCWGLCRRWVATEWGRTDQQVEEGWRQDLPPMRKRRSYDLSKHDLADGTEPVLISPDEMREWIDACTTLTPRMREILYMEYAGMTMREIADQLGISFQRVGQLLIKTRNRLRQKGPPSGYEWLASKSNADTI